MFEFEDHNSLEEQLLQAGAGTAVRLRDGHRQQVLEAARQAGNRNERAGTIEQIFHRGD